MLISKGYFIIRLSQADNGNAVGKRRRRRMWRLTLGVVTKKDPHAISHELVCDKAQAAQLTCSLRSFPRSRAGGGLVEDQERHA